jgi:membrane-associated phospholipid phosphatase
VYVRLHHASDVVAGAAFGVALGLVMRPFVNGHS